MTQRRVAWPWAPQQPLLADVPDRVRVRVWLGSRCTEDRLFALPARVTLGPAGTFALDSGADQQEPESREFALLVPVGKGVGLHLGGRGSALSGWLQVPDVPPWSLAELRADAHVLLRTPVVPLHRGMAARLYWGVWRLEVTLEQTALPQRRPTHHRATAPALGLAAACVLAAALALVPAPQTPAVVARAAQQRDRLAGGAPARLAGSPAATMAQPVPAPPNRKAKPSVADRQVRLSDPLDVGLSKAAPAPVVLDVRPAAVLGPRAGAVLATSVPVWRASAAEPAGQTQSTRSSIPSRAANTNNGLPNRPAR